MAGSEFSYPLENPRRRSPFRKRLLDWYTRHRRNLPWRNTHDPYRIWLSEIMLQQTTVAAVIPYFDRFLERFPTVNELAAAPEADVLRLWEGLGYYSRARNIHKAAIIIASERAGIFPSSATELQKLPGIGRYTAGAIASFAFDEPAPIVEANTQRLYARLMNWEEPLTTRSSQLQLWSFAESLVTEQGTGELNQAFMELGSQVCKPVEPGCHTCPVADYCAANMKGTVNRIPAPKIRPEMTAVTHICVAIRKKNSFLLRQYQPGERWAGLWDFVRWEQNDFELPQVKFSSRKHSRELFPESDRLAPQYRILERELDARFGFHCEIRDRTWSTKHTVTRYQIQLHCFLAEWKRGKPASLDTSALWVPEQHLNDYPLSVTARKFVTHLLA